MDEERASDHARMKGRTVVKRKSDRELVVTRIFDGPARLVFEAWTNPELFRQWWVPKAFAAALLSCDMDVRVGGGYRLVFGQEGAEPMAFFGKYLEVDPPSRLAWTNEESEDGAVTTVTFEEVDGRTRVVLHERYPTQEALDRALEGSAEGLPEQFGQLDELLIGLAARAG